MKKTWKQINKTIHKGKNKDNINCISDILINKLRVTSYELISLRVAFIARVTSYFLHTSYELLFIARVTSSFLHTLFQEINVQLN